MADNDHRPANNTGMRVLLETARRELAGMMLDAASGVRHMTGKDPRLMERVHAHWRRMDDLYLEMDKTDGRHDRLRAPARGR